MAFQNLIQEILGVPGMNRGLAASRINEAFLKIQTENVWSFQCQTGGWLTANLLEFHSPTDFPETFHETFPDGDRFRFRHKHRTEGQFLSPGGITVVPFTNIITGDAVATAAWTQNVPYPPLLTQQQIRVPSYSLYNIIALGNNGTVAYASILTNGSAQNPGTYIVPVLDPATGAGATLSITVNADGTVTLPPIVLTAGSKYTNPYIILFPPSSGTIVPALTGASVEQSPYPAWTNPENATSSSLYTSANFGPNVFVSQNVSSPLTLSMGTQSIPSDAVITGVGLTFEAYGNALPPYLYLSVAPSIGSTGGTSSNPIISTTSAPYSIGGNGNLFGLSLTPSNINAGLLSFSITGVGSSVTANYITYLNSAVVTIYYSTAEGIPATFSVTLTATLTIDRPWMEPQQFNGPYMIYQAYYAAPAGFKRWFNIRDTTNNEPMDWWSMTQIDLAEEDPQREIFDQPEVVVPMGIDTRPGSATLGQELYELWPHPISQLPYTFMCQCNWPALSLPTDTVPYPLTEELVKQRTYEMVALWKESQKGDEMERGSGANWQFLVKAHHEEYKEDLKQIRIMDRHLMELYFTKARMTFPDGGEPSTYTGNQANVGW